MRMKLLCLMSLTSLSFAQPPMSLSGGGYKLPSCKFIVSKEDNSSGIIWGNQNVVTGASSPTDGKSNTQKIIEAYPR